MAVPEYVQSETQDVTRHSSTMPPSGPIANPPPCAPDLLRPCEKVKPETRAKGLSMYSSLKLLLPRMPVNVLPLTLTRFSALSSVSCALML